MSALPIGPLGVVLSPRDERDRSFQYPRFGRVFAAEELPKEYICPRINELAVKDQGAVSSCVAHSLTLIKEWHELKETGRVIPLSPGFLYANRRTSDYQGPGMVPREALSNLREFGIAPLELWSGIAEYGKEVWPTDRLTLLREAQPFRINTYLNIDYRFILEMKSALMTTGPVAFAVPLYDNFRPDADGKVPMPGGVLIGYHQMAIIGWIDGWWVIQNSWGEVWGKLIFEKLGRCLMLQAYPAMEIYGVTDAVNERVLELHVIEGCRTVWLNGEPVEWDVAPCIVGNRFAVSGRLYSETFGDNVKSYGRYTEGLYAGKQWAVFQRKAPY